jgi:hypothetical protein
MKLNITPIFFLLFTIFSFGQKFEYSIISIPDSLKQNANSVVRLSQLSVDIISQKSVTFKSIQAVTVLNELGLRTLDLSENYDKNTRINKIEATAYDAFGKELKKYKRKDFRDTSVADGYSVFSDNRALYLDYIPITYPFTIVFETEVWTSNTAFIPPWSPVDNYLVSTQDTSLTITYKSELNLKKKENNFSDKYPIQKKETASSITYSAKNLVAKKREELSPGFMEVFPTVRFALENFALENVDGNATNWQEFGKWYYNSLLADTEEIPAETQIKINSLVGN